MFIFDKSLQKRVKEEKGGKLHLDTGFSFVGVFPLHLCSGTKFGCLDVTCRKDA